MASRRTRATRNTKTGAAQRGDQTTNQYEIWSQFTDHLATLAAKEARRLKDLASSTQKVRPEYTLGDFVLDQLKNTNRLFEAYHKASKKV